MVRCSARAPCPGAGPFPRPRVRGGGRYRQPRRRDGRPPGGAAGLVQLAKPENPAGSRTVMRSVAPLFDVFVIDDFLCTGDVSEESVQARGDGSWSRNRCELSGSGGPRRLQLSATEANPDITMIVKFPQWYDLFHEYGYAVASHAARFERVWVGTETRGARTQRYGFVQPTSLCELPWIASIAPDKTESAWFDHGIAMRWISSIRRISLSGGGASAHRVQFRGRHRRPPGGRSAGAGI